MEKEFCVCKDWQLCGCGGLPLHCMWCCLDLSPEQLEQWDFEKWEKKGTPPCICRLVEDGAPNKFRLEINPGCLRHKS